MRYAPIPRAYVRVSGVDAEDFLNRMVSNDVRALAVGDACSALLLTAKGRVIAPLRILRRAPDDFLLLTEPDLGEPVSSCLRKMRIAAKVEIEPEEHSSFVVFPGSEGIAVRDYGMPASEVLDADVAGERVPEEELERLRILACTPAWGKEIDDSILPAEAGLTATHVSFSKGCYPGQEPIARLHYRGHPNRALRVLEVEAEPGAEVRYDGKPVGRVTSAARGVALAYVRREVPEDAELEVAGAPARAKKMPSS